MATVIFAGNAGQCYLPPQPNPESQFKQSYKLWRPLTMQFSLGSPYPLVLGYKCNPKHPVFWHNLCAYLDIRNQIPRPTFSLFEIVICITDNTYPFRDVCTTLYWGCVSSESNFRLGLELIIDVQLNASFLLWVRKANFVFYVIPEGEYLGLRETR